MVRAPAREAERHGDCEGDGEGSPVAGGWSLIPEHAGAMERRPESFSGPWLLAALSLQPEYREQCYRVRPLSGALWGLGREGSGTVGPDACQRLWPRTGWQVLFAGAYAFAPAALQSQADVQVMVGPDDLAVLDGEAFAETDLAGHASAARQLFLNSVQRCDELVFGCLELVERTLTFAGRRPPRRDCLFKGKQPIRPVKHFKGS